MLDSSKFTYVVREDDTWNEDHFDVFREHTGQAFHIENFRNRAVAEALATLLPKLHKLDRDFDLPENAGLDIEVIMIPVPVRPAVLSERSNGGEG